MLLKTSRSGLGGRRILLLTAIVTLAVAVVAIVSLAFRQPNPPGNTVTNTIRPASAAVSPAAATKLTPAATAGAVATAAATSAQSASVGGQAQETPVGSSGQRAFIDPKTGKLRQPEEGETLAFEPKRRAMRDTQSVARQQIVGVGGAVGLVLTEDDMISVVATKNADGTVTLEHVTGKKNADAAALSPKAKKPGDRKEQKNDR